MSLSSEQIEQFNSDGYVLLRGALKDGDVDPVIGEYEEYIDRYAHELKAEGKIDNLHQDEPFERRLAQICRQNDEIYAHLDIMHFRGRASFEFLGNDNLIDMVECLVGSEIMCSPIQHTRAKLPTGLTPGDNDAHVAAWHQDAGVAWEEADPHFILTVWLPLVAATPENGCLQIIPRTHGRGLVEHVTRVGVGTIITDEELLAQEALTMPMEKGDVLLLHKEIPHRSTPNHSDMVRWSMDLRYQKTGTPTGRPFYPDFVVRSRENPDLVLTDYDEWCRMWVAGLEEAKKVQRPSHRWQVVEG